MILIIYNYILYNYILYNYILYNYILYIIYYILYIIYYILYIIYYMVFTSTPRRPTLQQLWNNLLPEIRLSICRIRLSF